MMQRLESLSLQLFAMNSLETKGLSQLEYKSAPWYLNSFKAKIPALSL